MNKDANATIRDYYDYTLPFYRLFWHGSSDGVHYGYWGSGARSLREAILAMNELLADAAHVTDADRVLDAGCGIGGSAAWLADNRKCEVVGITISERQLHVATARNTRSKTTFLLRDYLDTQLPAESFSVVWGLESVCYAHSRIDEFAQEMYRLLKPGGRIIIGDGFVGKEGKLSREEQKLRQIFEEGFVLEPLITPTAFVAAFTRAGFKNVHYTDITTHILPTAKRMYWMCIPTYPLAWLAEKLGLTSSVLTKNNRTGIVQLPLFASRALVYGTFYAEK